MLVSHATCSLQAAGPRPGVCVAVALGEFSHGDTAALSEISSGGSGVKATSGETPSTFIAALFAGSSSVSIVGSGGFEPYTDTLRLFHFLTALAGRAVTSLVLTYLMQVYTARLRRNTVALDVDT